MKLIIDDHEPKKIQEQLSKHFDVEVKRLDIGDYVYGDIAVERKEANDYINSLFSNRLFTQAKEMTQYEKRYIIVHGNVYRKLAERKTSNNVKSYEASVASLMYDYLITPLIVNDENEFVDRLILLLNRTKEKETTIRTKRYKKNRTPREVQIDMLCCIDKVGRKKAEAILDDFNGFRNIWTSPSEEAHRDLLEIIGIGSKLADNIMKVIE